MDLANLLDKNSLLQLTMLKKIIEHNYVIEKNELLRLLEITEYRFKYNFQLLSEALDDLKIDASLFIEETPAESMIHLEREKHTNFSTIYYAYLRDSLDYQILYYIYINKSYTIPLLALELMTSESVIYRRLRSLNQLLKEFHLSLKNGKLRGSEIQICHFYFQLFWITTPIDILETKCTNLQIFFMIDHLDKLLSFPATREIRLKLYLWIDILRVRSTTENTENRINEKLLYEINQNKIYQLIRETYFQFISQYASSGSEYKALYLFLFISSNFILDANSPIMIQYFPEWPTTIERVIQMNKSVEKHVFGHYWISSKNVSLYTVRTWKLMLTRLHNQLLFFPGELSFFYENEQAADYFSNEVNELAKNIVRDILPTLGYSINKSLYETVLWNYSEIISQIEKIVGVTITIGVSTQLPYPYSNIMVNKIRERFSYRYKISCQVAFPNEYYDLLITDSEYTLADYSYSAYYLTTVFEAFSDFDTIEHLILNQFRKKAES